MPIIFIRFLSEVKKILEQKSYNKTYLFFCANRHGFIERFIISFLLKISFNCINILFGLHLSIPAFSIQNMEQLQKAKKTTPSDKINLKSSVQAQKRGTLSAKITRFRLRQYRRFLVFGNIPTPYANLNLTTNFTCQRCPFA